MRKNKFMLLCIISFAFLLMAVNTPRQTHFDMLWIGPHTASPTLDVDPNDVYIHGDVETGRDAKIGRDISVGDDITITDDATVGDDLAVIGDTTNTGTITGTKGIRAADPNNSTTRYIELDHDGTKSTIKTKYGNIVIQDPNGSTLATISSTGGFDNNDNNITNVGEIHLDTLMSDANSGISFNDENITNAGEVHLDSIHSDANTTITINDAINVSGQVTGTSLDAGDGNLSNVGEAHLDSIHSDGNTTIPVSDPISVTGNIGATTYGSDSSISDAELLTLDNGATTEILVGGGAGSAPVWTTATGTGAPVRAGSPTFTTSINLSEGNLVNGGEVHLDSIHSDANTTITVSDPINVSGSITGTSLDGGDGAVTNLGDVHLDNIYSDANSTITIYDDTTIDSSKTLIATEYTLDQTRSLNQYASITAATTDTANWTKLVATEAYTCPNSAITIASGDTLEILQGAILTPQSNTTLTINGNFEAGLYQCFDPNTSSGADAGDWVTLGENASSYILPEWWGAVADDSTDCTEAIQSAYNSIDSSDRRTILLSNGIYKITDEINIKKNIALIGQGKYESYIKNYSSDGSAALYGNYSATTGTFHFENFTVSGIGNAASGECLYLKTSSGVVWGITVKNCAFGYAGTSGTARPGVYLYAVQGWSSSDCTYGSGNDGAGVHAEYVRSARFVGDLFIENAGSGIDVGVQSSLSYPSVEFSGCSFTGNTQRGIYGHDLTNSAIQVLGCSVYNNTEDGIELNTTTRMSNIIGCTILNNGDGNANEAGVKANNAIVGINNCTIFDDDATQDYGVYSTGASIVKISNCDIRNNMSGQYAGNGIIYDGYRIINNSDTSTSGAGEDDLKTQIIEADILRGEGGIEINAAGTVSGTHDTKTIKLYFGTANYTAISQAAGDGNDWKISTRVFNTDPNAQRIEWNGLEADGTETFGYETATEDTTANVTVKLTGECADPNDVITQTMWSIKLIDWEN